MRSLFTYILLGSLLGALLGFASNVHSEALTFPYRAEILVKDRNGESRKQAIKAGLEEVLVKNSGREAILNQPQVRVAIDKRAQRYLLSFGYSSSEEVLWNGDKFIPAIALRLDFDGPGLKQLLRSAQQTLWSPDRPNTLVWLVTEGIETAGNPDNDSLISSDQTIREVVSRKDSVEIDRALTQASTRRGTPLSAPLMDLEDQIVADPNTFWMMDEATVNAASQRYNPDGSLLIRYSQTSQGDWRGSWLISHKGKSDFGDGRAETVEQLVTQAVNALADFYAHRYAVRGSLNRSEGLVLTVDNVQSFADYRGVLDDIRRLTMVRNVHLVLAQNTQMTLMVVADGSAQKLQQNLALIKRLSENQVQLAPVYMEQGTFDNPLRYIWGS